jgi:hypothetical protein
MEKKEFKPYPDAGALYASQSKKFPMSPDYWGTIAINLKDLTNVQTVDGLTVFKLSGWKKQGYSGKTYLSISIDRYVPEQTSRPQERRVENDDDNVPF